MKQKLNKVKLNITLSKKLKARIRKHTKKRAISCSQFICVAAENALNEAEALCEMRKMMIETYPKIELRKGRPD